MLLKIIKKELTKETYTTSVTTSILKKLDNHNEQIRKKYTCWHASASVPQSRANLNSGKVRCILNKYEIWIELRGREV